MRRAFVWLILAATLAVAGCGAGVWFAVQPQIALFLVPGAFDVQVVELGPGQRLITYRMGNPQAGWNSILARRLKASGWIPPDGSYMWGTTEQYTNTYTRRSRFWVLELWEQARLDGDPRLAYITVRHWITYP